ncbi:MAG: ComEC/Rec2 family competence protein [Sarcina sp.]
MFYKIIKFIFIFLLIFNFQSCTINNNLLEVHFIDIGQGDSTLIKFNSKILLIDSGPNSSEEKLITYLKKNNVTTIDYLIATHPHEDHIGNIDAILKNFNIKKFFSPKVLYKSKDFTNMISTLNKENLDIVTLNPNLSHDILISEDIHLEIFSPAKTYENINNYSPIIKLTYFNNSFLFTGDAEKEAEASVLSSNIDSDVLKVGHHGSSSSSSMEFLEKVTPSISVISCGIDNSFNHPHKQTLENLEEIQSQIFRTDEDGSIILISDGTKIEQKK